jgi:hypothetical protein
MLSWRLFGEHTPPGEASVPVSKCSSGTWGTARTAQWGASAGEQSFSSIGENPHYKAEVQGALAHRDVRHPEA